MHQTADALLLRSRIKRDQKYVTEVEVPERHSTLRRCRFYDDALADLLTAKTLDPNNGDLDRYINRLNTDLQQCHETLL